MNILLGTLALVFGLCCVAFLFWTRRLERQIEKRDDSLALAKQELEAVRQNFAIQEAQIRTESQAALSAVQSLVEQQVQELKVEASRIREHYENEVQKALRAADERFAEAVQELDVLRKYESVRDSEAEATRLLREAQVEAEALRAQATSLLDESRRYATEEHAKTMQDVKRIREQADQLLTRATRDAARIEEEAAKRAEQVAGDAYLALRDNPGRQETHPESL